MRVRCCGPAIRCPVLNDSFFLAVIRLLLPVTDVDRENANAVHSVDIFALTLDALIVMKVRRPIENSIPTHIKRGWFSGRDDNL